MKEAVEQKGIVFSCQVNQVLIRISHTPFIYDTPISKDQMFGGLFEREADVTFTFINTFFQDPYEKRIELSLITGCGTARHFFAELCPIELDHIFCSDFVTDDFCNLCDESKKDLFKWSFLWKGG